MVDASDIHYDVEKMLSGFYTNLVTGTIRSNHIFKFSSKYIKKMEMKSKVSHNASVTQRQNLRYDANSRGTGKRKDYVRKLQVKFAHLTMKKLPEVGLKPIKQLHLYTKWRKVLPQEYKDVTCPLPSEDVVKQFRKNILKQLSEQQDDEPIDNATNTGRNETEKNNNDKNNEDSDDAGDNDNATIISPTENVNENNDNASEPVPKRKTHRGNKRSKPQLASKPTAKKKKTNKRLREVQNDSDDDSSYIPPPTPTLPRLENIDLSCVDNDEVQNNIEENDQTPVNEIRVPERNDETREMEPLPTRRSTRGKTFLPTKPKQRKKKSRPKDKPRYNYKKKDRAPHQQQSESQTENQHQSDSQTEQEQQSNSQTERQQLSIPHTPNHPPTNFGNVSITPVAVIDNDNSHKYKTRRRIQQEKDQDRLLRSQQRKQKLQKFTKQRQQTAYRTRNMSQNKSDDTTTSDMESINTMNPTNLNI